MMKKQTLALLLVTSMSHSVFAEKMSYEDAIQSGQAHRDSNQSVNISTPSFGLEPDEVNGGSATNEMGTWRQVGASTLLNAGQYSSVLAPTAVGQSCVKGSKGWVSGTKRECNRWNSGGWMCQGWGPEQIDIENGYKAECK